MLSSLFGFGKRRRRSTKRSTKKHHSRKPPARLLKICKKYRVKATKKVGKHRVYKSVAVLKRACLKKARALRKKLLRKVKKHAKRSKRSKKSVHRRRSHRMRMGEMDEMSFGRRYGFGLKCLSPMTGRNVREEISVTGKMCPPTFTQKFGRRRGRRYGFGGQAGATRGKNEITRFPTRFGARRSVPMFGKRRGAPRRAKVSKAKAMKAFRSFYKRHCAGARRSRYGFGDGGNPYLSASMGTEFCPNGMGGVLGPDSTGLFPTPCRRATPKPAFGRRRYRRSAVGAHHR